VDAADGEARRARPAASPRPGRTATVPGQAPGDGPDRARQTGAAPTGMPGLPDATHLAGSPFQRDGRLLRLLPFAAVAAIAEASLALPPGPQSTVALTISLVLLAATAGAVYLPWERLPRTATVLVPLFYLGSVVALTDASGGTSSGTSVLLLVPVVWTALFHQPWESGCVVVAVAGAGIAVSFFPAEAPLPVIARRVIFLVALAVLISVAAHGLRASLRRSEAASARLQGRLRELTLVADRDRIASSLHDTVVQRLFRSALSLQGIGPVAGHPELTRRIEAVVRNLDDAIKLLRQSIFGLAHGMPEKGLRRSILDVSNELTPLLGIVPEVALDGPLDSAVPPRTAAALLTALREALTQSGCAARATRVVVAVTAGQDDLCLAISDNGIRWAGRSRGDGPRLGTLRELARRLHGTLQVSSAADGEERLTWRVPLPAAPGGQPGPPARPAPDSALARPAHRTHPRRAA
jgi:signal transduction histidine kinase